MTSQKTIKNPVSLSGVGLHTGKQVNMTFKPAEINSGFTFVRVDLEDQPAIKADITYVQSTNRGTNLVNKGVSVQTTEHVLAALVGCDLDNVVIELDNSEPPILDGSSKFFVEALEKAGVVDNLLRLSVGVEDIDDLIDDLKRALKAAEKAALQSGGAA